MLNTLQTQIRRALLGATLAVMLGTTGEAQLAPAPSMLSVWNFRGNCQDCAEVAGRNLYPVRGTLTLNGYLGGQLSNSHFVSFRYEATNLIPTAIDVTGANFTSISGDLASPIQTLTLLFGRGGYFRLLRPGDGNPTGVWATCPRVSDRQCELSEPADYGNQGAFTREANTTVPEPSSYALMALGLSAIALGARRKQRQL
jgi:hypothetical protein